MSYKNFSHYCFLRKGAWGKTHFSQKNVVSPKKDLNPKKATEKRWLIGALAINLEVLQLRSI